MMAVRPPPYPEQFGTEADQDANSLLTELDKGKDFSLFIVLFLIISVFRSSFDKDRRAMRSNYSISDPL